MGNIHDLGIKAEPYNLVSMAIFQLLHHAEILDGMLRVYHGILNEEDLECISVLRKQLNDIEFYATMNNLERKNVFSLIDKGRI